MPDLNDNSEYDFFETKSDDKNICDFINETLTVRADGSVVPCCYDLTSKLVVGNIHNQSLSDIWSGEQMQMLRDSIEKKDYISICKNCATVRSKVYLVPKWKI